ncbi:MAG: tryptophan--tRNA ligase [Firmicutes bacterium]|nr:tryptophan--tRNA ligase [Bacillota bacterium]
METNQKKTILTGIRPTGNLHLGHLFGAVENWLKLQDNYHFFLEIADVQALTDNFNDPDKVRKNVYEITTDLLSVGINPEKANIFIQSQIPEIAELTVFYSNLVTMARLYRNPTVKTEIAQKKALFGNSGESVTYGFVGYPISQAADITAFKGELIPVGEDQLPLIEQCREIVRKFNSIYGETLIEPEPLLSENPRIKGLDGNEKMGKSLGNAIYLVDDEETIQKKIMNAVTDTNKIKKDDPADPNKCMVYYYHKLIKNDNLETVCQECKDGSRGCVQCKKELITKMNEFLTPIRENKKYYQEHKEEVNKILNEGTKKAQEEAKETIKKVKASMRIDYKF